MFDLNQTKPGQRNLSALSYLLEPVTRQLLTRIGEMAPDASQWLELGFEDEPLGLPDTTTRLSLLSNNGVAALRHLPSELVDGVVINLQLAWVEHTALLNEVLRVLRPGGHLFFATFGPDTLFELREAWQEVDPLPHVHPFVDLHLLGDAMIRSGFEKPILDSDWVGVEYEDVDLLMDDLRASGFRNVLTTRRKTLTGKSRMKLMRERLAKSPGPLQITWEITYGYARRPQSAAPGEGIRVNLT